MGMRSYFREEEIEIKDKDGLMTFLEEWSKANPDDWRNGNMMSDEGIFTFALWEDIKLISYWYPLDVTFLSCIAKYLEGSVHWDFECDDESGYVEFYKGECIFTTGQMEYNDWKIDDRRKDLESLNEKTKRLLICSRIE